MDWEDVVPNGRLGGGGNVKLRELKEGGGGRLSEPRLGGGGKVVDPNDGGGGNMLFSWPVSCA